MNRARVAGVGLLLVAAVSGASDVRRGGGGLAEDEAEGLVFRLSEGSDTGEGRAQIARPPAGRLGAAATSAVLDRLPEWKAEEKEEAVALREESLPPPRAGRTVETTFPPTATAERPNAEEEGPLVVVRRAPEGAVPLAPQLSVTFSRPMVAVASHADLASRDVPVKLSPQPPGEWRWVGTRTLIFAPEGRFPMATEYRVEVPAGTRASGGEPIASAEGWGFTTPTPRVVARHPEGGPSGRDSLVFVAFDQRIDPQAVLRTVQVRAAGVARAIRLATGEEVEAAREISTLAEGQPVGRWMAVRTEESLPVDSVVTVSVGPGTPSAEGPGVTAEPEEWSFRTRGPLRVREHFCRRPGQACNPGETWRIRFTNPLDGKAFRRDRVTVSPDVPGLTARARGPWVELQGQARGRATYEVTLSPEIRDVFGQTLGEEATLRFEVGPAQETLFAPWGDFVVLDPAGPPRVPVYSVNYEAVRVRAWAVTPEDWTAWRRYRRESWRDRRAEPPGRPVLDTRVAAGGADDTLTESTIDLTPGLVDGLGHLILDVRPVGHELEERGHLVQSWVQSTRLGLDAFADERSVLTWVTALRDGRALTDVEVALGPGDTARTDARGLARLTLGEEEASVLVARQGSDVAFLPADSRGGPGTWRRGEREDSLSFFVFDDRRLYRPGEEARVKGWVRRVGAGPEGDVEKLPSTITALAWTLRDVRGNEIARGSTRPTARGGFDLALDLPPTMNLGRAGLTLEAEGATLDRRQHVHTFEVQEFRRPEYEVKVSASEGPHVVGGHATATSSATYYAGGPLPGADVGWRVSATAGAYRPPHREGFVFGTFVPWWDPWPGPREPETVETLAGRTDGAGVHRLRVDFDAGTPPRPRHVQVEASVTDVNRQAWTAATELLVHPAELYVGLRSEQTFVQKDEAVPVDVIVTDIDGAAVSGRRVHLRAERQAWDQIEGEWQRVARDVQEREAVSGTEPVRVRFEGREGGAWRVVARVADDGQRLNETELPVWVAGGPVPPRRRLEQDEVTLVPDRREYRAGEVARILVLAPFAPAEGLLTLGRSGLVREERFVVTEGSHTLEIPLEEGWTPNVHVEVSLVGSASGDDGSSRPAFARGSLDLDLPPLSRRLEVGVTPGQAALAPGEETFLDLTLQDDGGRPVPDGEIAVVVVDEAVLALTGYTLPDPLEVFYSRRQAGVQTVRLRADVLLRTPVDHDGRLQMGIGASGAGGPVMALEAMPMARAMMAEAAPPLAPPPPIRTRTDFSALALFVPGVVTDGAGRARVPVRLPDNLTRYRVMAVAAAGERHFGSGEATLVARLPLMVRPSPPRFLNFGDRFALPVVVQNQTDGALAVDVAVRARNAELLEGAGRRLVVAAHDRAEVRFPTAAVRAGSAGFQVGAVSGALSDAAEIGLPVWTPATTEAFATYGHIDEGAVAQPVQAPENVFPAFGGLEVTTSSTALQALTDALLYLIAYPFECAEQVASRVLAVAALRDVLAAFDAEGLPGPEELQDAVERDLRALAALQNPDGGFAFWQRGERSWPWISVHAAHALARAEEKGWPVPPATLDRSRAYLRDIEAQIPDDYPEVVRRTLLAYALSVRGRLDEPDPGRARALVREAGVEGLSFEALGWLLPALSRNPAATAEADGIRRRLSNGVVETAAAAHFAVSYADGAHLLLHSDRRADAVILEALVEDQPESDLIPKLVSGLLAHRKGGRWSNTQENVFVLLALDRYFQAYEKAPPDFVARAWLGNRFAGEHAFRGHSSESHRVQVPMRLLDRGGEPELLLAKDGPGRLYYRIGMRYAPESLRLDPLDRGFTVERKYEGADDEGDVRRDADGTWRVRNGARVRVRLSMVAPTRRYHVALVDPLPAGLEAVNPSLATTGSLPGQGAKGATPYPARGRQIGWWWRPWFEHQNLRDERVEAFASFVRAGVHTYEYVARATTPGTFVVPPPKAEEMYTPETFGRGGSDVVVVE